MEEEVKVAGAGAPAVGARAGEVRVRVLVLLLLGMYHLLRFGVEIVEVVGEMGELEVVLLRRRRRRSIKLEVLQLLQTAAMESEEPWLLLWGASGASEVSAVSVEAEVVVVAEVRVQVRAILTVDLEVHHQQVAAPPHHPQAAKQKPAAASPLDSVAPMPAAPKSHTQPVDAQLQESPQYYSVLV